MKNTDKVKNVMEQISAILKENDLAGAVTIYEELKSVDNKDESSTEVHSLTSTELFTDTSFSIVSLSSSARSMETKAARVSENSPSLLACNTCAMLSRISEDMKEAQQLIQTINEETVKFFGLEKA